MIVAVDFLAVPDREKTEVEFFISDQRLLAVTAHLNRRDRDTWKFFQKLRIDMGKHADATTGSDSEGEMSRFASEHIGDLVVGGFLQTEDFPGGADIDFSDFRELPVVPCAEKERCAEIFFQLQELLIQRRLADKELFRRP